MGRTLPKPRNVRRLVYEVVERLPLPEGWLPWYMDGVGREFSEEETDLAMGIVLDRLDLIGELECLVCGERIGWGDNRRPFPMYPSPYLWGCRAVHWPECRELASEGRGLVLRMMAKRRRAGSDGRNAAPGT